MWNSRWLLLWDITQWQFNDFINGPCSSALGILEHAGSTVGGRVGVISHSQITENRLWSIPFLDNKIIPQTLPPPPTNTHAHTHLLETNSGSPATHAWRPYCNVGKCQCKLLKFWFRVGLFLSHCKHLIIHTMEQMAHSL